jgi:hypothetical protein
MTADESRATSVEGLALEVVRLARQVSQHDAQVRSLSGALRRVSEQLAAAAPVEPLPSWLTVVEFPDALEMVAALEPWIDRVYLQFPDTELPTCWAWHPWVVEELWWLRNAWCDAYGGEKSSWQKVGDWHDRQRPNVTRRIRENSRSTGTACRLGKHVDHPAPAGVPLPEALHHVVTAWCSPERTSWPPTPTHDQLTAARQHEEAAAQRRAATRR